MFSPLPPVFIGIFTDILYFCNDLQIHKIDGKIKKLDTPPFQ